MGLGDLQRHWDAFGRLDPHWAILNEPGKLGGGWDDGEFFETGRLEVTRMLAHAEDAGARLRFGRALDFGCGIGRVTQALCERFSAVDGVDIAPSMIEKAKTLNREPDRCRYLLNERSDLTVCDPARYDFVYSRLVLQHMEPKYALRYIREFFRLLDPGGVALFQVPARHRENETTPIILPDAAFAARIEGPRTVRMQSGAPNEVKVRVRNESTVAWEVDTDHPVRLGNHWRDENGSLLVLDDGRVTVPNGLAPGEEADLVVVCYPPTDPGTYALEIDAVQEGVAWFAERGSSSLCVSVEVLPRVTSADGRDVVPESGAPKMEMHTVPVSDVHRTIEKSGGTVLDTSPDDCTGDWESFLYCAVKRQTPRRRWFSRRA